MQAGQFSRRLNLFFAASAAAAAFSTLLGSQQRREIPELPAPAPQAAAMTPPDERALSFRVASGATTPTAERPQGGIDYYEDAPYRVVYFHDGGYDPVGLDDASVALRDRIANLTPPQGIDPKLLDLLSDIQMRLKASHPGLPIVFNIISGYRNPYTNAALRADPDNPFHAAVAKRSQHIHARAVDIFVPGVSGEELRDTAWMLQKGGVGWYPQFKKNFPVTYAHVDTGPVRKWGF